MAMMSKSVSPDESSRANLMIVHHMDMAISLLIMFAFLYPTCFLISAKETKSCKAVLVLDESTTPCVPSEVLKLRWNG